MLLFNIKDEVFIFGECVERVGRIEDVVKVVIVLGFNLINYYKFF